MVAVALSPFFFESGSAEKPMIILRPRTGRESTPLRGKATAKAWANVRVGRRPRTNRQPLASMDHGDRTKAVPQLANAPVGGFMKLPVVLLATLVAVLYSLIMLLLIMVSSLR
jgi:hypothetical protein